MVRGIRPFVVGRTLTGVRRCRCLRKPILIEPSVRSIAARVKGSTITTVRRIAKRVILELDSQDAFVIEPRMTGLVLLSAPPSREHLRFEWNLAPQKPTDRQDAARYDHLWFWDRRGLGTLRLYSHQELQQRLSPPYLGPDALLVTPGELIASLAKTRRDIKVALLDQTLVAGIGNLYASEILHLARIAPQTPANQLGRVRVDRLQQATVQILETAIRHEGSTLNDGTYRNVLNQNGSYQSEHRVYAREGELCSTCSRSKIRRIVQTQRSTFFCPRCQRK